MLAGDTLILEARFVVDERIECWVDVALEHTQTANLPASGEDL